MEAFRVKVVSQKSGTVFSRAVQWLSGGLIPPLRKFEDAVKIDVRSGTLSLRTGSIDTCSPLTRSAQCSRLRFLFHDNLILF
jgi:hypothetical protein